MTQTLTILRGLPASGKSTFVEDYRQIDPEVVVVSRDSIRNDFFGRERGVDEDFVTVVEHAAIRAGLESGADVISDNTNIKPRYVKAIANIGFDLDAKVEIEEFVISEAESIRRNIVRGAEGGRRVPDDAIKRMANAYKKFKLEKPPVFEKYTPNKYLPECILFDVDGTLAEMVDRRPFDWAKVGTDTVVDSVAEMTHVFKSNVKVIIFSGRDTEARQETINWLLKHGINFDDIFMRDEKDMRPDTIVKMEMFDKHIRDNYYCLGVFDDRPSVVRQWMKHNVPVFHVKPYAKDF